MGNEHGLALMSTEERIKLYDEKARKRFTFLRGVCTDGHHPNLTRALGFARERHRGQTRKSGEPYIIHPLSLACDAVGMEINDDVLLAALVLHDLLEDTECPNEELEKAIGSSLLTTVLVLTKSDDNSYDEYIRQVLDSGDSLAILVKRADIKDHFTQEDTLTEKLINKYLPHIKEFL